MRDLWCVLLQTLTASGVAVFLLVLKALFRDKLSPRWQFSVWGILALVLLIPAGSFGRHLLLDWPLWIDTLKGYWLGDFTRTKILAPIPLLPTGFPGKFAEWLFLIYLGGVGFFSLRYLFSYIRLRKILGRGVPVKELTELTDLQKRFSLPGCRAVRVGGITSAFVCGVIRPILVLPENRETDSKVLLHELLHLKNRDVIWGILIAGFRCIHWCNPLLWYCANQALDDMESLCDQRVLEHLEGEDRREYGKILLSMANETYARAPGTSSAANGGSNIRKRIEAIARFKRYPKGMGLVSVCILVTLIGPLLIGTKTDAAQWQFPDAGSPLALMKSLTAAKRTPCTTFAGALDAYAKAMLSENTEYRMLCLSDARQDELLEEVKSGRPLSWSENLPEPLYSAAGYWVYNLREIDETHLEVLLILEPVQKAASSDRLRICTQNVELIHENGRWIAQPLENVRFLEVPDEGNLLYGCRELPAAVYAGEADGFRVRLMLQRSFRADNRGTPQTDSPIYSFGEPVFQTIPNPDLELEIVYNNYWMEITCMDPQQEKDMLHQIGLSVGLWEEQQTRPELPFAGMPGSSGSGAHGEWCSISLRPGWDNPIHLWGGAESMDFQINLLKLPGRFAADLYLNETKTAELELLPEDQP